MEAELDRERLKWFLDEAEISDEDRRKIYHRNAERIFGIPDC